jgi:hypothetical protein
MLNNKELIYEFLDSIKDDIIREQEAQGRVASGNSINGYIVVASSTVGTLYGASYVGTLETGRKPGKIPKNLRFTIWDWINDKGLFARETEKKKKSIAYLIARKIANEGTLLHRQGGNSGVISDAITEERLKEFSDKLLDSFVNETVNTITLAFK